METETDLCQIGHLLEGPCGERLRVPLWCYGELQKLKLKHRYSIRLSPEIYKYLVKPGDEWYGDWDQLMSPDLRRILGDNLTGPDGTWLQCNCAQCRKVGA